MAEPNINQSMLEHALRDVRRVVAAAERGDPQAQCAILRYAAADALEASLKRVAALAHRCTPSLDEVKINRSQFTLDAIQLRFEIEQVGNVLNRAAGRAVVVALGSIGLGVVRPEHPLADPTHDSGEFPPSPTPSLGGAA